MQVERKCKNCGAKFMARKADVKRGWARFCSKSCKAKEQEKRTGQYSQMLQNLDNGNAYNGYDADMDAAGNIFASGVFGHGQR